MKHDKPPFIASTDRFGGRILVRAGTNYEGTNVTVTVDQGRQVATGQMQQNEAHLVLPGTLPESYSLVLTYPKLRPKAVPASADAPIVPVIADTVAPASPVDPVTHD